MHESASRHDMQRARFARRQHVRLRGPLRAGRVFGPPINRFLQSGSAAGATAFCDVNVSLCRSLPGAREMVEVLACLMQYGQRLDVEIAKETGVSLEEVRMRLLALAATGAVITCSLTRYQQGKRLGAWLCRVSGYVPPPV